MKTGFGPYKAVRPSVRLILQIKPASKAGKPTQTQTKRMMLSIRGIRLGIGNGICQILVWHSTCPLAVARVSAVCTAINTVAPIPPTSLSSPPRTTRELSKSSLPHCLPPSGVWPGDNGVV